MSTAAEKIAAPPAETDLERTVREEQEAHEAARAAELEPQATDEPENDDEEPDVVDVRSEKKLFDDSDYEREDLAIAKIDGNQVDRIALKFAGEVFLDRSSPEDVALYNRLKLGHDITLRVEGRCNGVAGKGATDREGDLDVVVGQRSIKVHTVYLSVADGVIGAVAGDQS